MTYLRIFGAIFVLFAVFLFGLSLTWRDFPGNPAGFPLNRTFVAVSFNGVRFDYERMPQLPVFEVRRTPLLRYRASGTVDATHGTARSRCCRIIRLPGRTFPSRRATCRASRHRGAYLRTLLQTTRWRTESGTLILENDNDTLRFQLAPGRGFFGW